MFLFVVIVNILLLKFTSTNDPFPRSPPINDEISEVINIPDLRTLQNSFQCIDKTSCNNNGACAEGKKSCICDLGWDTFPVDSSPQCNYQQKKQLVAFLLELFVGFGGGHFYTERYLDAGLKLVAFLFGIYIICLFPLSAKCISDKCDSDAMVILVSCFYYICAIGLATWFIYDLVMFGMNKHLDGNGRQLLPWGVSTKS